MRQWFYQVRGGTEDERGDGKIMMEARRAG
jgi:hypothetical protein